MADLSQRWRMLTRKMDYAALATAGALGAISFGMSLYFMPRSDLELKDYAIPLSITAYIYIRNAHRFTLDKDPPPSGDPLPDSSSPPESLSALRRTCLSVLGRVEAELIIIIIILPFDAL